jgi:hypothetical protein
MKGSRVKIEEVEDVVISGNELRVEHADDYWPARD